MPHPSQANPPTHPPTHPPTQSLPSPPGDDSSLAARIRYVGYSSETQLPAMMALVDRDLSEPYSIFTYRYFLSGWPELCILAYLDDDDDDTKKEETTPAKSSMHQEKGGAEEKEKGHRGQLVGVIVGKADNEGSKDPKSLCGYIAMLAVETSCRRAGIGHNLVRRAVDRMVELGCQEVALEAEVTNAGALHLYERQGFAREERMFKYYLNGVDAFRLKLWLAPGEEEMAARRIQHGHGHGHVHGEEEGEGGCCGGHDHHHDHHPDHHHDDEAEAVARQHMSLLSVEGKGPTTE